jgi:superfamily II DNA or RNA helicase
LIAKGKLEIQIAIPRSLGDYHDKMGIIEDHEGNVVAFYGSSNSSKHGYRDNYDKIRVAKSWIEGQAAYVDDEIEEFKNLWGNTNDYLDIYSVKQTAQKNLFEVIERRSSARNATTTTIKLRDYQTEAIQKWKDNDYHGFYVMATGTGKTWTAIYSAKELLKEKDATIVICAPYKHLVKQWEEDVRAAFSGSNIVLVSSDFPNWEHQLNDFIVKKKHKADTRLIVISTISSFYLDRFTKTIAKDPTDKLLIVDEAHRFTKRDDDLQNSYKYLLGLSATPYSGKNANSGKELMNWFGGEVYNLPIEKAIKELKCLVPYYYHPIYVHSSIEEEERFNYYSRMIPSFFKNGVCVDTEGLFKTLRSRLRVISMAQSKLDNLKDILSSTNSKDHLVVYCGDGRLISEGNEIRYIRKVKQVLNDLGHKSSQFTASENLSERMQLVDSFNKGTVSSLAAIRCLDEGINIPSIKSAVILSSNDDYREFVQRRGRILRKHGDKKYADIYDVIVLPSEEMTEWAKIEFRRYLEYAKIAINSEDLTDELGVYLENYDLSIDDVNVYDYEDM